jgi:hypothetical protein
MSQLESYSILEKINEWKKEEGIVNSNVELPPCMIPRPVKLIMEIEPEELNLVSSSNTEQQK